jgi:hypothetical protein
MPTLMLVGFAIVGVLSLMAAAGVAWVFFHPEPPAYFGPDSKLNT